MKRKKIYFIVIIISLLLTACGSYKITESEEEATEIFHDKKNSSQIMEAVKLKGEGISIKLKSGMNGYVKYNRYMKISAEITSSEKDFSGWLRVILPMEEGNSMYQKEVVLKMGQTEQFLMYLPANMRQSQMLISLNDTKGEEICSKAVSINMLYGTDTTFVGVYSKKQNEMGYFDGIDSQMFYLKKSDFTEDYRGLDILDMIVISDVNLDKFSEKKIKALRIWVKRGGTLVLADSGSQKELKPFKGKLLSWKKGEQKKIITSFGIEITDLNIISDRIVEAIEAKKAEKVKNFLAENLSGKLYSHWRNEIENIQENPECLEKSGEIFNYLLQEFSEEEIKKNLSLSATEEEKKEKIEYITIPLVQKEYTELILKEAESIVDTKEGKPLFQKVKKGLGNIVVAGCSLALEKEAWDVSGTEIMENLEKSFSEQKKQQLLVEKEQSFGISNYVYKQGLLTTETNNLPNLKLYGVILVVYILLIGPVYYVVFRKKGKPSRLWIAIPLTALFFSVFIYLLGTSTRIHEPYVNYLSHLHLEEEGGGELNTWFRLINNKNTDYSMVLDGNYDIEPLHLDQSYSSYDGQEQKALNREYHYGIEYGTKETKIHLKDMAAFEGRDFKDQEIVACEGDVLTTIVSDEMTLRGTILNQFSYDLEDCFLYDNGTVYLLGRIPSGDSISLSDLKDRQILLQSEYNYDYTELVIQIFQKKNGRGANSDYETKRREALVEGYLQEGVTTDCFFFGFAQMGEEKDNSFMSNFSLKHYGTMGISKNIDITYRSDGMEVLPDISEYAVAYDASVTDGKSVKEFDKRIVVRYELPKGYQWKGLAYNQNNNAEFSYFSNGYRGSNIFAGTVTVLDRKLGQEVQILESGQEMKMEIREEYLNEDDVLSLYYYLDDSVDSQLQLPTIMVYVTKTP